MGTRRSTLAQAQTDYVCAKLKAAWPDLSVAVAHITTEGDRLAGALNSGSSKGLFTSALEEAMLKGTIDLAVHSLKDLPSASSPGLRLGAILGRATARDVLVSAGSWTIDTLPGNATVGTSSVRRRAQLKAYRPDLKVQPVRGNVDTRLKKMEAGEVDSLVLAQAGLLRLGVPHSQESVLPLSVMLPAPGQGALAVQCRSEAADLIALLRAIDCPDVRRAAMAERAFLVALGGGCATPVAAYAQVREDGSIRMQGAVASPDGQPVIRVAGEGRQAETLGNSLARDALRKGAAGVLRGS